MNVLRHVFMLILDILMIKITLTNHLQSLLEKSAGVYIDKSKSKELEKTVLITACNHGYLNHLHNFKCFADRLGFKFLVFSMESQVHDYITNKTSMISYLMSGGKFGEASGSSAGFRDKHFNMITAKKIEAVHDILTLGYDVIFSDLDVAILQDPIPFLIIRGIDYVHSVNAVCEKTDTWKFNSKFEGNTGFYFVRSTAETIALWKEVYEAAPKFAQLDDQAIFWKIIRQTKDIRIIPLDKCPFPTDSGYLLVKPNIGDKQKGSLTTCSLDGCMFSSGMLSRAWIPEFTYEELLKNLELRNQTMYTIHANYIKGGNNPKMVKLREHGFWLATKSIGTWGGPCKPYQQALKNISFE